MTRPIGFEEALEDAKSDPDMMDTIASALSEVKNVAEEIAIDLTDETVLLETPVKELRDYVTRLGRALDNLDSYGHAKQHYRQLQEHL